MKYYLLAILIALPSIAFAEVNTFTKIPFISGELNTGNFVQALFNISIAIAAVLVVVRLILAGSKYMLSGLVTSKESAKQEIRDALLGLLIILGSVTILQTINPQLLNLNALGTLDKATLEGPGGIEGAYVDGNFNVGESKTAAEILDFCSSQANRDELCRKRIEAALSEMCRADGGVMTERQGPAEWNGLRQFIYYCD